MLVTTVRRSTAPEIDQLDLRTRVNQILNRHPAVGLAVGVVRNGRLEFFHGHGVANVVERTPVTEDTIFRIASITKTFTAIAAMQLWEKGLVDLDAPANSYLRAFQLIPARNGDEPATLRHLMTHTAGLPETVHPSLSRTIDYAFGESYTLDEPLPTLAEYYGGALKLVSEPGTRFAYTDHSFAVAGQIVEEVSGLPLDRYLRLNIFEPLGMAHTDLLRSELVTRRLATGYILRSRGAKAIVDRQWITAGASSIYSSSRDMALYVAALLGGGANEHGSVLKPQTLATMFAPHYQPDPRIPGLGFAFDRINLGDHAAVGHEGVLPGFNSQIWLAPDDGVGVMGFTNGSPNAMFWLPDAVARLLGRLLGAPDQTIRKDLPQHPEVWGDICGWYPFTGPLTEMRARSVLGLGAEVFIRRGRLMVRTINPIPVMYRGFDLHADDENDPYAFRFDLAKYGIESGSRLIFSVGSGSTPTRMHFDLLPMSLEKRPPSKNHRNWIAAALGAAGLAAIAMRRTRKRRT